MTSAADLKRFETARARLALRGFAAVRSTDDAGRMVVIVSRWAMTRQLSGLPELEKFTEAVAPRPTTPRT